MQRSLVSLSLSYKEQAWHFVWHSGRLFMVVYNNINFTFRKASQHLDNATHQINATTLAVISLPTKFTRAAYEVALSVAACNKNTGLQNQMTLDEIKPMSQQQAQLGTALKHNIR